MQGAVIFVIKVAMVAACDRNNYGDVLMPMVFEQYIKSKGLDDKLQLETFALTEADMSYIAGKHTRPLNEISDHDAVVFLGGEILGADYMTMYSHMTKRAATIKAIIDKLGIRRLKKYADDFCRNNIFHGKHIKPWMYTPSHDAQKVYYNCVGGGVVKEWADIVSRSRLFSARDWRTHKNITKITPCLLIPCTVTILSELFDDIYISEHTSPSTKIFEGMTYYVMQANKKIGKKCTSLMIEAVNRIYRKYNMQCVLLPIGRTSGHEDQVTLEYVHRHTPNASVYIPHNNLFDTISIIKNAECYIGTSLHGAITAMSYNLPHTALSKKSGKLITYLQTWQTSGTECVNTAEDIEVFIDDALTSRESVNIGHIDEAKAKVRDYLEKETADILA